MDTIFWLTYYYELFVSYVGYYITYILHLFADYPVVVKIAASSSVLLILAILTFGIGLLLRAHRRHKQDRVARRLSERFEAGISAMLSEDSNPDLSRMEAIQLLGVQDEKNRGRPLLRNRLEKRMFAMLVCRKRIENITVKGRSKNLEHIWDLFGMPQFLENEVSMSSMRYKARAMRMMRIFKLPVSPWVINKLMSSSHTRVQRLAMYSSVQNSSSSDLEYFESEFFDKNCCLYDEIELAYALQRRRSLGLSLPNLGYWAHQLRNPKTQCVFVRLMRRFDQKEGCVQLADIFEASKDKKLHEEISRTWGYLHYTDGEQTLVDSLMMEPDDTKVAILHAIVRMGTGKRLDVFREKYKNSFNPHVRFEALRCMYNYGDAGKALFRQMEAEATDKDKKYFTFFHNPITLDKIALDKEQAYHPSIETVYSTQF